MLVQELSAFFLQCCWEPGGGRPQPKVAVLAQELLLYKFANHDWRECANLSQALSDYLGRHPLPNNSDDVTEVFKAHSRYIRVMHWAVSGIFVANSYGRLFVMTFSAEGWEVLGLDLGSVSAEGVYSLSSLHSGSGAGTLVVGRLDGTCTLVTLNSAFKVTSSRTLSLEPDYRPIECLHTISVVIFSSQ